MPKKKKKQKQKKKKLIKMTENKIPNIKTQTNK
jgi:hypothetical protein